MCQLDKLFGCSIQQYQRHDIANATSFGPTPILLGNTWIDEREVCARAASLLKDKVNGIVPEKMQNPS